jgi:hypothetical protein
VATITWGEAMSERQRSLTPRERRAFEEIQARLRDELPELDLIDARPRSATLWMVTLAAGVALITIGLLIGAVPVAFLGFVGLLAGCDQLLHRPRAALALSRFRHWAASGPPDRPAA